MYKLFSPVLAALLLTAPLFSQGKEVAQSTVITNSLTSPDADDMEALRRWIRDKRMVTVKEIGGDLSISGEVRAEFQDTSEVLNGLRQLGQNSVDPLRPQYAWDAEVNLMIDYKTDRTWAAIKLEFDNDMGQRSGSSFGVFNNIKLEKAYLGGRFVNGDTFTFDAEIGRRFLYNQYESRIEFGSLFDGLLFRFSQAFESIGNFYFNPAAFIINDRVNHYAFIAELGGLQIANTGLAIKYSIVDWHKPTANQIEENRYNFLVSQFLSYYLFYPEWIGKKLIKVYGAGLCNHLAAGLEQTGGRKQKFGWYAGVSIGTAKKKYDWAIDANYQWAQAQVVPDFDCLGIGRGRMGGNGLYVTSAGTATTQANAGGRTNYKGFELQGLYALTDNVVIEQSFKYSTTLNKNIGPDARYKQYEIEFIYAF
jgi:hypothetical protein